MIEPINPRERFRNIDPTGEAFRDLERKLAQGGADDDNPIPGPPARPARAVWPLLAAGLALVALVAAVASLLLT